LKLRLSEQYINALENILKKSNVVMVPKGSSSGEGNWASPKNIAQIIQIYNQMSGGNAKQSQQLNQTLGGGSDEVLKRIVSDLNDIKHTKGGRNTRQDTQYKYLDDKALYSTDA